MKQHKPSAKARSKTPAGASSGKRGGSFAAKPAFKASPKPPSSSRSGWSPMDSEPDAEMLQAGRDNERWLAQREAEHRRVTQKPAARTDRHSDRQSDHRSDRQQKSRDSEQRAQRQEKRREQQQEARRTQPAIRREPQDTNAADRPRLAGGEIIYGRHAVTAALQNPARTLIQLWLSDAALAATLPLPRGLKPQIAERRTLDRMVGDRLRSDGESAVHQGIVLVAEPLAELHLRDLLSEDKPGPLVILDQVTDPHNLGAILRSAAVFGAAALITTERHAPAASGVMAKAASGAAEVVPVVRVVNLARALREIGDAGYWRLGLAEGGTQTIGEAASGRNKVALVLGAEGDGLRRLTKENCDALVSLTATAPVDSFTTLNVSNAAAVALFAISQSA